MWEEKKGVAEELAARSSGLRLTPRSISGSCSLSLLKCINKV